MRSCNTHTLASYVGQYRLAPGVELEVILEGESLLARTSTGGGAVRLWPEAPSEFFVKEAEAQVTFTRNATGAVTGLVLISTDATAPGPRYSSVSRDRSCRALSNKRLKLAARVGY